MSGNHRFFTCAHCGNIVGLIKDKGVSLVCCGEKMTELIPNTAEASVEKHLPAVNVFESCVNVEIGSVPHPMEDSHNIAFVYLETERGGQRKNIKVGDEPKVAFSLIEDNPVAVYAYCNLHGLWKTDIK